MNIKLNKGYTTRFLSCMFVPFDQVYWSIILLYKDNVRITQTLPKDIQILELM